MLDVNERRAAKALEIRERVGDKVFESHLISLECSGGTCLESSHAVRSFDKKLSNLPIAQFVLDSFGQEC
jgi:hypothetical protein